MIVKISIHGNDIMLVDKMEGESLMLQMLPVDAVLCCLLGRTFSPVNLGCSHLGNLTEFYAHNFSNTHCSDVQTKN